jgi:hypothetical protein
MTDPGSELEPVAAQCPSCGNPLEASAQSCPACGAPAGYQPPAVDVSNWVKAGWETFARNIAPAVAIPLVVIVPFIALFLAAYFGFIILMMLAGPGGNPIAALEFGGVFFGIVIIIFALVMPALTTGVYACFLEGVRTGKVTASHLGVGFRNWWACTWVTWVLNLVMFVCMPFAMILIGIPLVLGFATLQWLALLRIVDRRCGGIEALGFAWEAMTGRMWAMIAFTLLIATIKLVGGVGGYLIGLVVAAPIIFGALAAAYDGLSRRPATETSASPASQPQGESGAPA